MLEFKAKGTIAELSDLFSWCQLSELIHVDYYNRSMVPNDEEFTITTEDLDRIGIIKRESNG